jgi:hypothetical protein
MTRTRFTAALALALLAALPARAAVTFHVGQNWSIKDSGIRIVIGSVEPFAGGRIAVGIAAFDVPCPPAAHCKTAQIGYAPYDSAVLAASVGRLLSSHGEPPDSFAPRCATWKAWHGRLLTLPVRRLPSLIRLEPNDPYGWPKEIWEE